MAEKEVENKDLSAVLADEIRQATNYNRTELAGKRANAIDYLQGVMTDTPARPNGSQQTSRDFADTVSWILPGTVRVFTASDQMVQYDKVREEEDEWSNEASEYTNYTFFRESDGYRILYNATYDSLTLGNGVVACYWEPQRLETKTFKNKTEMEVAELLEEGWEPTGVMSPGEPRAETATDDMTGDTVEMNLPTLTVKLQREDRPGKICDVTCKPENLLLNSTATTIEDARFVGYYHDDKTRSDLMEMAEDYGWDRRVIEQLSSFNRTSEDDVGQARDRHDVSNADSPFKSADPIDLYECYIRADIDGDGIAELVQAWYAGEGSGGTLLGYEEWEDEIPYTDIPCYPVPHRWDAESVFDRTQDIQRVKTVLLRQALDNTYAVNLPMREVEAGSVENPDILANPRFGATIWRKKGTMATAPIQNHVIPYTGDKSFAALQYMDEMIAKRTGVSRTTMALDPEALQNQTATASNNQRDAGYSQIELVARNMAELGWAKYFAKRLKLAIKHQQVRKIPSKKEESGFREINPSRWDASMAVSINTGLGTGSRDRDMQMLSVIKNGQMVMAQMLGQAGLQDKALEFLPKIRKTAVREAESSGLRDPEEYYPEITDEEVEQLKQQMANQPDPEMEREKMKIAAQAESEKVKAQAAAAKEQAQMEADVVTSDRDRQNEMLMEDKRQQLEREKLQQQFQIELMKLQQARELELMKLNSVETEEDTGEKDADGKPKKAKVRIVDNSEMMRDALERLGAMMSAPVEIVRDPQTGKAVGTRRVVN